MWRQGDLTSKGVEWSSPRPVEGCQAQSTAPERAIIAAIARVEALTNVLANSNENLSSILQRIVGPHARPGSDSPKSEGAGDLAALSGALDRLEDQVELTSSLVGPFGGI